MSNYNKAILCIACMIDLPKGKNAFCEGCLGRYGARLVQGVVIESSTFRYILQLSVKDIARIVIASHRRFETMYRNGLLCDFNASRILMEYLEAINQESKDNPFEMGMSQGSEPTMKYQVYVTPTTSSGF